MARLRKLHNPGILDSKGFSLIEMMVVFSLIGIAILGMISMSTQQIKLNKTMNDGASFNELRGIITQTMSVRTLCQNAAVPDPAHPFVIDMSAATSTSISDGAEISFTIPGGVIQKDQDTPGGELRVQSFRVNNAYDTSANDVPPFAENHIWTGQLWLRVEHNGDVFGPKVLKERLLGYVNFSISPASEVQSCYAIPSGGGGGGDGSPSGNIVGMCPDGSIVTGITANGVVCKAISASINPVDTPVYTPSHPGPGCIGNQCVTHDYGPCNGDQCITNGQACTGNQCCAGVACFNGN